MAGIDLSKGVVGVVGAGAMGAGIAEVAARAGQQVFLYDIDPDACRAALSACARRLEERVGRGKLEQADADSILANIRPVSDLAEFSPCALVIEAIVERLDLKQDLFRRLEDIVSPQSVLTSNTSSISITAIAGALSKPGRFAGLHFFNPAPVMKLVEVIAGLQTRDDTVQSLLTIGEHWGKIPAKAKSVPGFIVNRVARPYYAEGFLALEQGAGTPSQIDAVLTECAGFRMGPLALTDLIGHDVNVAVGQSVFDAYDGGVRFKPSLIQKELVAAGRLGRKTNHGVYTYGDDRDRETPYDDSPEEGAPAAVLSFPENAIAAGAWFKAEAEAVNAAQSSNEALASDQFLINDAVICANDGRSALMRSVEARRPVIVLDWIADLDATRVIAFAPAPNVDPQTLNAFRCFLAAIGVKAITLNDRPGLIALRTISMLINAACDAARDRVASEGDIDRAMRYGVNYPRGPFAWMRLLGPQFVARVLNNIFAETNDPVYAPSERLMRLANGAPHGKGVT